LKKQITPFIIFWVIDSILLYLAAWLLPQYFVLGNKTMSTLWAALASGLLWTFLEWMSTPIVKMAFKKLGDGTIMFGFYFIANFVALWITARMAGFFGFGTTSFVWLALLALIADTMQHFTWKAAGFKKMEK
jgi:uncharacterized membrane protein YvlD (DUF360 family)